MLYKQYKCAWRHSNSHCIKHCGKPHCKDCKDFEPSTHKHKEFIINRTGWSSGIFASLHHNEDTQADFDITVLFCPVCGKQVADYED